ncbi:uncharacterized protein LOC120539057 isoform X1 [Polypterus senegalus]|uniref:uncharacterized protein LOC120539057 isoform X1 n=1 Tax=Polypterus senegalus TaxID=55291 RepID=UPI0019635CF7|nr:uncharacterized protein LOC120539057 isoform X1 [Polypterus senegalus]
MNTIMSCWTLYFFAIWLVLDTMAYVMQYYTPGMTLTLPCRIVPTVQKATFTWLLAQKSTPTASSVTIAEVGKIKCDDPQRAKRLEVLQNSTLKIQNAQPEDVGLYTCQIYENNKGQPINTTSISLVLLRITASPDTRLHTESRLTLTCCLSSYDPCTHLRHHQLSWIDDQGAPLTGDRYTIPAQPQCCLQLSIKPLNSDHKRSWRCNVTVNGKTEGSASYLSTLEDGVVATTKQTTVTRLPESTYQITDSNGSINKGDPGSPPTSDSGQNSKYIAIVASSVSVLVIMALVILIVYLKKRKGQTLNTTNHHDLSIHGCDVNDQEQTFESNQQERPDVSSKQAMDTQDFPGDSYAVLQFHSKKTPKAVKPQIENEESTIYSDVRTAR